MRIHVETTLLSLERNVIMCFLRLMTLECAFPVTMVQMGAIGGTQENFLTLSISQLQQELDTLGMPTFPNVKASLGTRPTVTSAETAKSGLLSNASMMFTTTLQLPTLIGHTTSTICLGVQRLVKDKQGMPVTTIFPALADTAETTQQLPPLPSTSAMTGTCLTETAAATNA